MGLIFCHGRLETGRKISGRHNWFRDTSSLEGTLEKRVCLLQCQKTLTPVSNNASIIVFEPQYKWSFKSILAYVLGRLNATVSVMKPGVTMSRMGSSCGCGLFFALGFKLVIGNERLVLSALAKLGAIPAKDWRTALRSC